MGVAQIPPPPPPKLTPKDSTPPTLYLRFGCIIVSVRFAARGLNQCATDRQPIYTPQHPCTPILLCRRMVWLYVHRVYGIVHDDFNYQLVNTLFTDPNIVKIVKSFVKRTAGHPETFLSSHFYEWGYPVDIKERVHVALLSCESRKQAELIHGLRALSQAFIT